MTSRLYPWGRPGRRYAGEASTERAANCCTGECDQGRTCPLYAQPIDMPSASPVDRAIELVWWVGGVGLLGCLLRACLETPL